MKWKTIDKDALSRFTSDPYKWSVARVETKDGRIAEVHLVKDDECIKLAAAMFGSAMDCTVPEDDRPTVYKVGFKLFGREVFHFTADAAKAERVRGLLQNQLQVLFGDKPMPTVTIVEERANYAPTEVDENCLKF
jgi:hypothetical protein